MFPYARRSAVAGAKAGQSQLEFSKALPPDGVMFPYARRSAVAGTKAGQSQLEPAKK